LEVRSGTLTTFKANVGNSLNGAGGRVLQSGGTFAPGDINVGNVDPAQPGTFDLSDGQFRPGSFRLQRNGFFNQTGGEVVAGPFFSIGASGADSSQYVLAGGTIRGQAILIAHTNPAPIAASGRSAGFVQTGGAVNTGDVVIDPTGTYDALGGSINPTRSIVVNGILDFGGQNVALNLTNNCFGTFTGGQILNATNATFTGGVGSVMEFAAGFDPLAQIGHIQTEGIVHVAGEPLIIPADKSVGGSGTITGDVTNNGTVAPGNSPGAITISGNYVQGSAAALAMEIAGTSANQFDSLSITGSATLGGSLDVSLFDGFVPSSTDQFMILTAASLTGGFANALDHVDVLGGGRFDVLYSPTSVTLTNFQSVPEPQAIFALSLFGGGALLRHRRRKPQRRKESA
jgi:hypothetical protein